MKRIGSTDNDNNVDDNDNSSKISEVKFLKAKILA